MSNLTGPSASPVQKTVMGAKRQWYSFRENVDNTLRYIELGILFALPFGVALLSLKYAAVIVFIELLAWYLGTLIHDFDVWYNAREIDEKTEKDNTSPLSELEEIMERLSYFENEHYLTIKSAYRYLDRDEIPYLINNLDWIEIVSLLNRLSLQVGKRFDSEKKQKGAGK